MVWLRAARQSGGGGVNQPVDQRALWAIAQLLSRQSEIREQGKEGRAGAADLRGGANTAGASAGQRASEPGDQSALAGGERAPEPLCAQAGGIPGIEGHRGHAPGAAVRT